MSPRLASSRNGVSANSSWSSISAFQPSGPYCSQNALFGLKQQACSSVWRATSRQWRRAPAAAPSIRSGSGSSPTQSIVRRSLESARSRSKKGINGNGKSTSPPNLPTWWGGECSHTHPASPHGGEGNLRIELDAAGTAGRAGAGQPHRGRSRRQCQDDHRPHQGGARKGRRRGVLPRAATHRRTWSSSPASYATT